MFDKKFFYKRSKVACFKSRKIIIIQTVHTQIQQIKQMEYDITVQAKIT